MAAAKKTRTSAQDYPTINALGRSSFVTQRGITNLSKELTESNLESTFSRATIYRARKARCYKDVPPYGRLVELKEFFVQEKGEAKPIKIGFANPSAMLAEQCALSEHFSRLIGDAYERNPCSPSAPWNIIFYQDGVNPSDGLGKNQRKKSCCFYYSFLELGQRALAHEECWTTLAIVRDDIARLLACGTAGLASEAVSRFFMDDHDIRRAGVRVQLKDGRRIHIFAQIGVVLADALAFKEILAIKGTSSHKPCHLCMSCTNHKPPAGAVPFHAVSAWCAPL